MKMPSRRLVSALCLWTLAFTFAGAAAAAERGPVRRSPSSAGTAVAETEARVIVKFKSESGAMRALAARSAQAEPQQAQALSSRLGLKLRDGRGLGARTQLMFGSGLSSAALAAKLAADSDVEYAVVDGRQRALAAPNDPLYPAGQTLQTPIVGQWYLRTPDATIVSAINGEAAWDITIGSASIVVAVLDTGIRPEHPDLAGKIVSGYDFIHDTPTANDNDGRDSDPSDPGDAVTSADVGTVQGCSNDDIGPSSWHGTQTAGLIGAATNNGAGMASIGRNVMVQPLRVLGKCGGYDSDIIDAMRWAAGISVSGVPKNTTPAKVINMSLGSSGSCSAAYQDAVNQVAALGVVVVVAAGNDGLAVGTPANCSGVIAVAGVRHTGTKVGYSDLGPEVAISAPAGNCVTLTGTCQFPLLTTSNSGTSGPSTSIYTSGGSNASIGTSFSAPLVAGTAALMYSLDSTLTPSQIRTMLAQGARAFPASGGGAGVSACAAPSSTAQDECYCTTSTCGAGLLDAAGALKAVLLRPSISASSTSVTTGTPVTLDGSGSHAIDGASIATYSWAITSGSNIAGLSSTNAATTTLSTTAAGTVTVTLTVTDSSGRQNATSASVTVAAPVASSSGGGGGALEPWWLAGLLAATLILSASSSSSTRFGSRIRQSLRRARRSSAR